MKAQFKNEFIRKEKNILTLTGLIFGVKEIKPTGKNINLTYAKLLIQKDNKDEENIYISINLTDINKLFKTPIANGDIIEITGVLYNSRKKDSIYDNWKMAEISKVKIIERKPNSKIIEVIAEGE